MINMLKNIHQWFVDKIWKPSWTKFVAWFYGLPSAIASLGMAIGAMAGDNHIQQFMDKIHVPDWVPVGLAAIAMIHWIASGRDD